MAARKLALALAIVMATFGSMPVQAGPVDEVLELVDDARELGRPCDQNKGARACAHISSFDCDEFKVRYDWEFTNFNPAAFDQLAVGFSSPAGGGGNGDVDWRVPLVDGYAYVDAQLEVAEGQSVSLWATASLSYSGTAGAALNAEAAFSSNWVCSNGVMAPPPCVAPTCVCEFMESLEIGCDPPCNNITDCRDFLCDEWALCMSLPCENGPSCQEYLCNEWEVCGLDSPCNSAPTCIAFACEIVGSGMCNVEDLDFIALVVALVTWGASIGDELLECAGNDYDDLEAFIACSIEALPDFEI